MKKSKKNTILFRTVLGSITALLLLLNTLTGKNPPNQDQQIIEQPGIETCGVTTIPNPLPDDIDSD